MIGFVLMRFMLEYEDEDDDEDDCKGIGEMLD